MLTKLESEGIYLERVIKKLTEQGSVNIFAVREMNYKKIGIACLDFKGTFCK